MLFRFLKSKNTAFRTHCNTYMYRQSDFLQNPCFVAQSQVVSQRGFGDFHVSQVHHHVVANSKSVLKTASGKPVCNLQQKVKS